MTYWLRVYDIWVLRGGIRILRDGLLVLRDDILACRTAGLLILASAIWRTHGVKNTVVKGYNKAIRPHIYIYIPRVIPGRCLPDGHKSNYNVMHIHSTFVL